MARLLRLLPVAATLLTGGCYDYAQGYAPTYPAGYDSGMGSGQYQQPGDRFGGQDVASIDVFFEPLAPYGDWVDSRFGRAFRPNVASNWRPYVNGRWGENRLWLSDDPWGWATDHYGRWGHDERVGWVWVPATQWAPSWVAWREDETQDVAGWAPIPPGIQYSVGVGFGSGWGYDDWNSWYAPSWIWVPRPYLYRPGFGGAVLPWNHGYDYWRGSRWQYHTGYARPPGGGWYGQPGRPGYGGMRPPQGYGGGRPDGDHGRPRPDDNHGRPRPDDDHGRPRPDYVDGRPRPDFQNGRPRPGVSEAIAGGIAGQRPPGQWDGRYEGRNEGRNPPVRETAGDGRTGYAGAGRPGNAGGGGPGYWQGYPRPGYAGGQARPNSVGGAIAEGLGQPPRLQRDYGQQRAAPPAPFEARPASPGGSPPAAYRAPAAAAMPPVRMAEPRPMRADAGPRRGPEGGERGNHQRSD